MSEPGCLALYVLVTGCEGGIYRCLSKKKKHGLLNKTLGEGKLLVFCIFLWGLVWSVVSIFCIFTPIWGRFPF